MDNRYLLCLLLILALVGCNSSDNDNERLTVTIGSNPPLCPPTNEFRTICSPYLINESGGIQGTIALLVDFEYEFGTEYELLVEIVELADPPADGFSAEYRILEVLREEQDAIGTIYNYESVTLIHDAFVFIEEGVYSLPPHNFLCADDVDCDTLADMANSGGVVSIELTMTGGEIPVTVTNWN
ncbi:hypothetical protein A28LD_2127 [Idiomarina sp. A28L]|uniref:DUF4377 domain-containing protein n=1 Tax=Idiomarina sp. A28L TaxID=1036674 RepID=UPI0002138BCD|nr:DUF4377 domain-containing protein [Idiomarina sp. A28L]EGN74341.1 hypothetical protein A28LD_2127 [Idiomarina sp. A28L]